jgi:hypothetical protein
LKLLKMGVAAVAALALVSMPATASQAAKSEWKLKMTAGRANPPNYKVLGAGTKAQAQWTNKQSETGKFSVLLEKTAPLSDFVYAAAVLSGLEGTTVGSLGPIGFSAKPCGAGAPRFNLDYDANGDGAYDGTAFYGCANHVVSTNGDWSRMMVADPTVADNGPVPATATILALYVIVDEPGTYYVDNVTAAGQTVGEPNGS